jgi:transglutaminase-like putative cysteine protease
LAPAEYIDADHPAVQAQAQAVARLHPGTDEGGLAVALFELVRDIRYEADDFEVLDNYRASNVLEAGNAYCVPKAGLLAALARAVGIPAAVGFADVRNHLANPRLATAMGTDVFAWHGFTYLFLGGRWRSASPTFDAEMCERAGVEVLQFDGAHDALVQAFDGGGHMEYVVRHGAFHDVPARFLAAEMVRLYPFVANGGLDRFKAQQ